MALPNLEHFDYREYGGFYEPSDDTYLLVDALRAEEAHICGRLKPRLCLEIGTGSGAVIAALAAMLSSAGLRAMHWGVDVNEKATRAASRTAAANGVGLFEAVVCDLGLCLMERLRGKVDVLLFNPPYVPTPKEEPLLSPGGCLYMIAVEENGPAELVNIMEEDGLEAKVILQRRAKNELLCVIRARKPEWVAAAAAAGAEAVSDSTVSAELD